MTKLEKYDLQKIESYWRDIDHLRQRLKFREWELLEPYREEDTNKGGGKNNIPSDTTARKAMILVADVEYQNLKRIVTSVEGIYTQLDNDQKKIVQMRYWDKSDCFEWQEIADELFLSVSKTLRKRNTIIDETARRIGYV